MPYRNLPYREFQGDFWSRLGILAGEGSTMYPWQKELLMNYLLKSPNPHLQLQSFTAPEEYGRGRMDWGFWQKGRGFRALAALLNKRTDPAEAPIPPEIMPLYNLGFGKMQKDRMGRDISFRGFKPEDMLAVLFSKTQPQEISAKVPEFLSLQKGGYSAESFEQLASRLSHEQLWAPIYGGGKGSGRVAEAWQPYQSDEDKAFYLKQLEYGQGLLGKLRGEQEVGNRRYARSEASREKQESANILGGSILDPGNWIKTLFGGGIPSIPGQIEDEPWLAWLLRILGSKFGLGF